MAQKRNRRAGVEDRWRRADGRPSVRSGNGKRWMARFVDEQGHENSRSFDKRTDAQLWLNQIISEQVTGTYVQPRAGLVSVRDVHAKWLRTQGHLKKTTVSTRAYTWSAHVEPRWANIAVVDVETSAVRSWVHELVEAGAGPATIENAMSVLRQILALAVEDKRLSRNPCDGVKAPRREHRKRGYLTHQQTEALANTMGPYGIVTRFLAYTGLRWNEMAALTVADFEMLRKRVQVDRSVTEVRGKLEWSTPKSYERRSVPFPTFLVGPLAELMAGKRREDLVFVSPEGGVLRLSTFRPRWFAPAVARLRATDPAFPKVTPHDLRHTAASLAVSAGANPKAVQTMLGHKSAALTLDTYADLFPDDLELVSAALDERRASDLGVTADRLRTEA